MDKGKMPKLWVFIIVGALVYLSYEVICQQNLLQKKKLEMDSIQAKIAEENKISESLKKQKEQLNSDEYIEKVAREKLGMVKPGEKIFYDVDK